ncbi:hypothetical protein [Winogradskyella sp.]|uniref:hypothetical protein n=1 Tax=Winogradskyella sp. TaxID=1883156 RepID=UPI002622F8B3|nr:hypothetical protein [Winogradskyella sp.]
MKKRVFSLLSVFVFTISFVSAGSASVDDLTECESSVNCWKQSDMLATWAGANLNLTHEQEYELFDSLFDECVANFPCG